MNDLSVGWSVCPVHCGKTANQIRMPFGIIGRTGPGMRQVVEFGDRSTGRRTFGGEFGARHCPQGPIGRTCATAPRRGHLDKLLCTDLLLLLSFIKANRSTHKTTYNGQNIKIKMQNTQQKKLQNSHSLECTWF